MSTRIGEMAVVLSADTGRLAGDLKRGEGLVLDFGSKTARVMSESGRAIADSQAKMLATLRAGPAAAAGPVGRLRDAFGDVAKHAAGNLLAGGIRSAVGGLRDMVASSVDLAAAAEVSAGKFEVLTGSVAKARDLMADLKDFAAQTPVSLADANQAGVRLLSAGVDRDQIAPTLRALTEVAGGDPKMLADTVRAYTQVKSTGRLQADEWNQFANLGTLNQSDLAKVLKSDSGRPVDESEVKKMIEAGKVGFHDLGLAIKKATEEGGRFYGLTDKYSKTYAGRLDKLSDAWDETRRQFGQGLMEGLDLKGAVDDMAKMVEKAKEFGKAVGGVAGVFKKVAVPVIGAIADGVSGLYRAGQVAGAWLGGNLQTMRRGERAAQENAEVERRIDAGMNFYGLRVDDAAKLVGQQDVAADALRRQQAAEQAMKTLPGGGSYNAAARRAQIVNEAQKDIADALRVREGAAATIQKILANSNPDLIVPDGAGRRYVPPKPAFDPRLLELGGKLNERFADPVKRFRDDLADLTKLRDAGKLDPGVYAQAAGDLRRGLEERAGVGGGPELAQAAELGSQALANMVGRALGGSGPRTVEGLLEALNRTQQQALAVAQQIAQGVTAAPTVTMPE